MAAALSAKSTESKITEQSQKSSHGMARQLTPAGPYGTMLSLQHSAGNCAVSHLLGQGLGTLTATSTVLQRKCTSCAKSGVECGESRKKRKSALQRLPSSFQGESKDAGTAPPIVHEVLRSPGQRLDPVTRAFFEPRFGCDLSQVRVHLDGKAAESAEAMNAQAYTVGQNVAFGAGQYAPETTTGRRVLAHELTHVAQQRGTSLSRKPLVVTANHGRSEREADAVADRVMAGDSHGPVTVQRSPVLQRKVVVDKPKDMIKNPGGKGAVQTNAQTVENYLKTLCSAGSVAVDGATGDVKMDKSFCTVPPLPPGLLGPPSLSPAQASKTPAGCGCICDLVDSKNLWTIQVDDASWPHTVFDDEDAAKGIKPGGSGGTVTTPSPNSPKLWGAATARGKELDIDPWLVLGHELCGHGWLGNSGGHGPDEASPRGEGGHQETVKRENELRKEHGIELRGTFKDPNCGESYWRDKKKPGTVNWSSYRDVCKKWREAYNKKHGTKYKITDTIP